MPITVRSFGQLSEITGKDFQVSVEDTDQLAALLRNTYQVPADMKYLVAVNRKVISNNTLLNADDTVALLPPYSGG